jgi:hypothetical protein
MAEVRTKFPPVEYTDDEWAAVVGRFVMSPVVEPDPVGSGIAGREVAAPHGVVYVRSESLTASAPVEPEQEEEAEEVEEEEEVDLEAWTVVELKGALEQAGIDYPANARKAELIELLEAAEQ